MLKNIDIFLLIKIFAVEHPWYNKGYILKEVNKLPGWIIHWIRNSFLKNSKNITLSFMGKERILKSLKNLFN